MIPQVSAFRWVPPFAQGFVRDLRVRWALEEAGIPYQAVLIDFAAKEGPAYRAWQPFGQVPAYRDDEVEMFESGAILLHLAAKSETLAPRDPAGAAKVTSWVVAALNSIEPFAQNYVRLDDFHAGQPWVEGYRPIAEAALSERLQALASQLEARDYLTGRFSAADIVMTTVLRELVASGILDRFPPLEAYRGRGESRPAFAAALEAQLEVFRQNAPPAAAAAS